MGGVWRRTSKYPRECDILGSFPSEKREAIAEDVGLVPVLLRYHILDIPYIPRANKLNMH